MCLTTAEPLQFWLRCSVARAWSRPGESCEPHLVMRPLGANLCVDGSSLSLTKYRPSDGDARSGEEFGSLVQSGAGFVDCHHCGLPG